MGKTLVIKGADFSTNSIDTVTPYAFNISDLTLSNGYYDNSGADAGTIKTMTGWKHTNSVDCTGFTKLDIYSGAGNVGLFFDSNNSFVKGIGIDSSNADVISIANNGTAQVLSNSWRTISIPTGATKVAFNYNGSAYGTDTYKWVLH